MNTSMFLPQVPQHDVFDEHGNQIDDINSVIEYVMVSLGLDDVADDEDNDNGQNFNIVTITPCVIPPEATLVTKPTNFKDDKIKHSLSNEGITLMSYDVIVPPPKNFFS